MNRIEVVANCVCDKALSGADWIGILAEDMDVRHVVLRLARDRYNDANAVQGFRRPDYNTRVFANKFGRASVTGKIDPVILANAGATLQLPASPAG
jgi:hypothetical protein